MYVILCMHLFFSPVLFFIWCAGVLLDVNNWEGMVGGGDVQGFVMVDWWAPHWKKKNKKRLTLSLCSDMFHCFNTEFMSGSAQEGDLVYLIWVNTHRILVRHTRYTMFSSSYPELNVLLYLNQAVVCLLFHWIFAFAINKHHSIQHKSRDRNLITDMYLDSIKYQDHINI